jgi:pyruvate-formate lyase-activating enzyme
MTGKELGFKEPEVNWRNFEKACRLAQVNYVSTVLLTGKGEPTLYPKQVTGFLEHMKPYDFPLIEMQTNALVFGRNFEQYKKHLKEWYDLGLNTMAISIAHYDRQKNKEIYTPDGEYMDLEKVIDRLHSYGYSARLCCMMAKDYIDSPEEVKKLIDFSRKNNVEQLTVRSIVAPTEKSESDTTYEWTKEHALSKKQVDVINRYVERNAHKIMTLNFGATIYDFNGQNIATSSCLTIKPESDEIRQLIFFPDGHLRYDWQYKGAILM